MAIEYKGFRIQTWIDDDTNHAQMLKGRCGRERLYVDIDRIGESKGKTGKRFGVEVLKKHSFTGTEEQQLIEAAKLWVNSPELFVVPRSPVADAFAEGRWTAVMNTKAPDG